MMVVLPLFGMIQNYSFLDSLSNDSFAVVEGPRRQQTEYSGRKYMFFSTQNLQFWVYGNDSFLFSPVGDGCCQMRDGHDFVSGSFLHQHLPKLYKDCLCSHFSYTSTPQRGPDPSGALFQSFLKTNSHKSRAHFLGIILVLLVLAFCVFAW